MFPFILMLFLLGIPLMFLELAFGQYAALGPAAIFERFCPLFHGKMIKVKFRIYLLMKRKFKQWRSTIPLIASKWTTISHMKRKFKQWRSAIPLIVSKWITISHMKRKFKQWRSTIPLIASKQISYMKRKFKQWRSAIPPIISKRTTSLTSNHWMQKKPTTYSIGNPGLRLRQGHKCCTCILK